MLRTNQTSKLTSPDTKSLSTGIPTVNCPFIIKIKSRNFQLVAIINEFNFSNGSSENNFLNTASFVITGLDETSYATSSTSSKTPYFPY
jgi:hypothetical protein